MTSVTVVLHAIESGSAATEDLLPLVYDELRQLAAGQMRHERGALTLQATALVHEAFLRLVGDEQATWKNRRHFFGAAALRDAENSGGTGSTQKSAETRWRSAGGCSRRH